MSKGVFYRVYFKVGIGGEVNETKAKIKADIDNLQRNFKEPKHAKRKAERAEMVENLQKDLESQIKKIAQTEQKTQSKDEIKEAKRREIACKRFGREPKKTQEPMPTLQCRHFALKSEAMRFIKQHYDMCSIMFIYRYSTTQGWEMIFDKYNANDF